MTLKWTTIRFGERVASAHLWFILMYSWYFAVLIIGAYLGYSLPGATGEAMTGLWTVILVLGVVGINYILLPVATELWRGY